MSARDADAVAGAETHCFGGNGRGCCAILGYEVMRVWCLSVARQSAIDDKYISKGSTERHCGRESCITTADNNHIVLSLICHYVEVLNVVKTPTNAVKFRWAVKGKW
jgi:hypothetical protein